MNKTYKNIRISNQIDEKLNILKYQLMIKKVFVSKKELVSMLIEKKLDQMIEKGQ